MGVDLSNQLRVASGAAMLGVAICLVLVTLRVAGYFLHGAFWRFLLDILRVLGAAGMTLLYFQHHADGQIRWYDLVCELSAGFLFYICIGRFLEKMLRFLIGYIAKVFEVLLRPLRLLISMAARGIKRLAKITSGFLKKLFIFSYRYIIMLIYPRKNKRKEPSSYGKKAEEKVSVTRFYH